MRLMCFFAQIERLRRADAFPLRLGNRYMAKELSDLLMLRHTNGMSLPSTEGVVR